jgi:hypothetical protein
MPVTFNTNNNYNVEIIEEPNALSLVNPGVHGAPQAIKYSSINNTPYVELKITPDLYQYPLLAGNMNFDGLYRFLDHHTQNNVNNTCTPPLTPHGVNTTNTFGSTNFTGTLANGNYCGVPPITTNVTSSFQGPFQSHRSFGAIYTDQLANGVAWTKVIWVEVYEDDNGQMVNTSFSPELNEDLASWQLWNPNNPNRPITNNIYPQYIRAFVFLEFAPSGPGGLINNVDIFIDIDEDIPVYGCTNPSATNYNSTATVDDGSCVFGLNFPPLTIVSDFSNTNHTVYNVVAFNGGSPMLGGPYQMLVLENFDINVPSLTGGTPPYTDYEIEMLGDNVNTNGSPSSNAHLITSSGTVPPSRIVVIDDAASTFDPATNTYTDCVTINLPESGYPDISAGPGVYSVGKIILDAIHPSTGVTANAVQDITVNAIAEDDTGTSVTSSVSANISGQYI